MSSPITILSAMRFLFISCLLCYLLPIYAADCHGQVCHPVEEYCSSFGEHCDKCDNICNQQSHNYDAIKCDKECAEFKRIDTLKAEIHVIKTQQSVILILLIILLVLIVIRYAFKCINWLRQKRCITTLLKKLQTKKHKTQGQLNVKDAQNNVNVLSIHDIERATSPIYSVTGAEGSVMTMTTPVSTRYPAENSTTPTTIAAEHSYDNEALAITPVSEKPSGNRVF